MPRKGNCLNMAESFFAIMKTEQLYAEMFESLEEFTLNGKSPVQYRALI